MRHFEKQDQDDDHQSEGDLARKFVARDQAVGVATNHLQIVIEEAGECGLALTEGEWQVDRLTEATEVMAISTIREVQPVSAVGLTLFDPGKVTALLAERFFQRRG